MKQPVYRPCVGVMLINPAGLVFIARRRNKKLVEHVAPGHEWQMPQGGIDPGEDPWTACLRELHEETNVTSASLLAEAPDWYAYDLPDDVANKAWRGRYQGAHKPEFDAWRWEPMANLPGLIIPFKRPVYEKVVADFAPFAGESD